MAHSLQMRWDNIQRFLRQLDDSPRNNDPGNLRNRVSDEDPDLKVDMDMRDHDGYAAFWNAFYNYRGHCGPRPHQEGEDETSHEYACCSCS